jgi:hypothetical protein
MRASFLSMARVRREAPSDDDRTLRTVMLLGHDRLAGLA